MTDMTSPMHEVPKSVEQQSKPSKKQYRATTTWHLKPPPPKSAICSDPLNVVVENVAAYDLGPLDMYEAKGAEFDRGPIPAHPIWRENLFILRLMLVPIVAQWALYHFTDYRIPALDHSSIKKFVLSYGTLVIQFLGYQLNFIWFATRVLKRAQRWMQHYGTLNEDLRGRDIVPDSQHRRVILGLVTFIFIRGVGQFALPSDRIASPSLSVITPIKMGLFLIALDYFFYAYHRTTHEVDSLWFIHRQHHATKSPTPSMSLWADEWQDSLEWAIIPMFSFAIIKLTFAELYLTAGYLLYVEAFGHSGVRAYFVHPLLAPVLTPFGVELAVEDHDLHHRYGRGGKNYGKQSRIWDRLFNTIAPREEAVRYASKWEKKD